MGMYFIQKAKMSFSPICFQQQRFGFKGGVHST